jgi:hypothetical protein
MDGRNLILLFVIFLTLSKAKYHGIQEQAGTFRQASFMFEQSPTETVFTGYELIGMLPQATSSHNHEPHGKSDCHESLKHSPSRPAENGSLTKKRKRSESDEEVSKSLLTASQGAEELTLMVHILGNTIEKGGEICCSPLSP